MPLTLPVALNYLTLAILLLYLFKKVKFLLHMFQQKGYKLNEFDLWLRKSPFRNIVTAYELLFVGICVLVQYALQPILTSVAQNLIFAIFSVSWFAFHDFYGGKQIKKPLVSTARMKRLYASTSIFMVFWPLATLVMDGLYGQGQLDIAFISGGFIISASLSSFIVMLAAWVNKPIEDRIQEGFKRQAREKLKALKHLKTIAITGSYGKTSVKFMIQAILRTRYQVCYTPGSFNTPMGICKVINNDLNASHQILILEMGARYVGNIEELTQIARPNLSVVTNVGYAHLETFGSQDAIAHTKGAIVRALKEGETAILNSDDPRVSVMGEDQPIKRLLCGFESGAFKAENIRYGIQGCSFDLIHEEKRYAFHTPLLGKHNISNLLYAIAVGYEFGIRIEAMIPVAAKLEPTEHRLQLKKTGDLLVIDDAFNSNPVGATNAVDILASFDSGNRYLITPGMVELGDREVEENFKWGQHIGEAQLDQVLLVGKKRTEPIYNGIKESGFDLAKVQVVSSLFEANDWLQANKSPGDVVLYENDLPDSYNE